MTDSLFVHALALGLEGTWRRISQEERCQSAAEFAAAVAAETEVTTFSYSMVGLQAGTDLLLWSLASSLDALEERSASVLRAGMGQMDDGQGELPRHHSTFAIRQEADPAGAIALHWRALSLSDRLSLHEEHRLVPSRPRGTPGDHERAHARRA